MIDQSGCGEGRTELVRLDERIAAADASQQADARWQAADALYDKAELVQQLQGDTEALPLYQEVADRLRGAAALGPRVLLIRAMYDVASIQHRNHISDNGRAAANTLLNDHLADAPPEASIDILNAVLILTSVLEKTAEREEALRLFERLTERSGRAGDAYDAYGLAVAECGAAWLLGQMGDYSQAIARYAVAIDALHGASDRQHRGKLAEAWVRRAALLQETGLVDEARVACEQVLEAFDVGESKKVTEHLAWARVLLCWLGSPNRTAGGRQRLSRRQTSPRPVAGHEWFLLGTKLQARIGRAVDAQAAYLQAVAVGYDGAWLNIGVVSSGMRRCADAEELALRAAMTAADSEYAAEAGLRLGNLVNYVKGDLKGAEEHLKVAERLGTGALHRRANVNLAYLAAYQGNRAEAYQRFETTALESATPFGLDTAPWARRMAKAYTFIASGHARRIVRSYSRAQYLTARRARVLKVSSRSARWIGRVTQRVRPL